MAGGKLSPRQKMINLMYLIFIAMLAMQMDKKVLSSFGFMKEKIEDANVASSTNIDNILTSLNTKASDQPDKFADLNTKAKEINKLSENLFIYMSALKDSILADTDDEDKANYESMSGGDRLDEMFFKGEGLTAKGEEFVVNINTYRNQLLSILGTSANPDLITNVKKRFNTDPEPARDDDSPEIPWIYSRYEGMPMITSLANITQIQGDVKNTEAEIYTNLLGGQLESEVSLTNYEGIVALNKTAYFAGERVEGKVVLGRYDNTLIPTEVILNGRDATDKVKDGQVIEIDSLKIKSLYTPGHTSDSYSFLLDNHLFTGDTLLINGTGRTDFQNGSSEDAYNSLFNNLLKLPEETLVYPGHDYNGKFSSTIGNEKKFNPRLQVKSVNEYVDIMSKLNLARPKMIESNVSRNIQSGAN